MLSEALVNVAYTIINIIITPLFIDSNTHLFQRGTLVEIRYNGQKQLIVISFQFIYFVVLGRLIREHAFFTVSRSL